MEARRAGNSQGMYQQQGFQFLGNSNNQVNNIFSQFKPHFPKPINFGNPVAGQSETICQFCKKTIPSGGMSRHTSACEENPDNIILPCDFCGEHFSLNELEKHFGSCSLNPKNQRITCESCGCQISLVQYENHIMTCVNIRNKQPRVSQLIQPTKLISCMICNAQVPFGDYGKHITTDCSGDQALSQSITKTGGYETPKKVTVEDEKEKECAICFLEFGPLEEVKFLQCFHRYHKNCIDSWNQKVRSCPICLTSIDE